MIELTQVRFVTVTMLGLHKNRRVLEHLTNYQLLKEETARKRNGKLMIRLFRSSMSIYETLANIFATRLCQLRRDHRLRLRENKDVGRIFKQVGLLLLRVTCREK